MKANMEVVIFDTPEMIYGKETEAVAREILKGGLYDDVKSRMSVEGGLGHKYYEEYRALSDEVPEELKRMKELERISKEYWNIIRGAINDIIR